MEPAWKDTSDDIPDEEGLKYRKVKTKVKHGSKYESRLIDQFHLVHGPTPSWAHVDTAKVKKRKAGDIGEVPEDNKGFVRHEKTLQRGDLKIFRVLDLNNESRDAGAIIRSVKFHPTSQVGLVAGSAGIVTLFQVDGAKNTKIQSVNFENFPLRNACFSMGGEEILVSSGLVGHFYSYDMMSGETSKVRPNKLTEKETIRNLIPSPDKRILLGLGHHGNMYLFSTQSKEMIGTLCMNGDVSSVAFNSDGSRLYSSGVLGEVYTWDINSRLCVDKFVDHGTVSGTAIAVSDDFLACGSNAGVVNLYQSKRDLSSSVVGESSREPEKALLNLVTPVTSLEFNNPSGEVLVMASKDKNNAVKMVHLPSMTVFSNFPYLNTDWGRANTLAFSPNSGYFCMGNNKASAYLFRLKHYENY